MDKSNSKRFLSTFNKVMTGTGVLATLGVGSYFLYRAFAQEETPVHYYKANKSVKPFAFADLKITESWEKRPYLGEEGLKKLSEKVKNDLGVGPEVVGLNSINLTDGEMISEENNGYFQEATKEIYLNSNTISGLVPYGSALDDRVQAVYQTLFHEYGHFIASSYLKNVKPGTDSVADIYLNKSKETWNEYFTNKFKHLLKYDVATAKYKYAHPIQYGYVKKIRDLPLTSDAKYAEASIAKYADLRFDLITHLYDVKELFDISNGQNTTYPRSIAKATFGGLIPGYHLDVVKEDSLRYLYTMDELYTRKYQQIRMKLRQSDIWRDGWVKQAKGDGYIWSASTFAVDAARYQRSVNRQADKFSNSPYWQHAADSPYDHDNNNVVTSGVAPQMWSTMLEMFGQDTGADISYITSKNASYLIEGGQYQPVGNSNLIKFGGYISPTSNYNFVGYYDNSHKFHSIKISKHDFTYGYKNSLTSTVLTKPKGENVFYVTDEYVDKQDLVDRPLYFSDDKDGTNVTPMTTTRATKAGKVTSWFSTTPDILKKHIYNIDANGGKVYIREASWD